MKNKQDTLPSGDDASHVGLHWSHDSPNIVPNHQIFNNVNFIIVFYLKIIYFLLLEND